MRKWEKWENKNEMWAKHFCFSILVQLQKKLLNVFTDNVAIWLMWSNWPVPISLDQVLTVCCILRYCYHVVNVIFLALHQSFKATFNVQIFQDVKVVLLQRYNKRLLNTFHCELFRIKVCPCLSIVFVEASKAEKWYA